jgi:hypothetical protein
MQENGGVRALDSKIRQGNVRLTGFARFGQESHALTLTLSRAAGEGNRGSLYCDLFAQAGAIAALNDTR